jgi:hypothetical protein
VAAEVRSASVEGQFDGDKARLVIQADLKGLGDAGVKPLYASAIQHSVRASAERLDHTCTIQLQALQGALREVVIAISGEGSVRQVSGQGLEDWSVRQSPSGGRFLVLRFTRAEKTLTAATVSVAAETPSKPPGQEVQPLAFTLEQPALAHGYLRVEADPGFQVEPGALGGLLPIEYRFLPEAMRTGTNAPENVLAFRFQGTAYALPLRLTAADPESRAVVFHSSKLSGVLAGDAGRFTLAGVARVRNPRGGSLVLLAGGVALTEAAASKDWRLRYDDGRFLAEFDHAGEFPVQISFDASVRRSDGWSEAGFKVASGVLQPFDFRGLARDAQLRLAGASRPEWSDDRFTAFLPPGGEVRLAWKETKAESEGTLFFAAEALSQVTLSPGLMRQATLLDFKVLQGELHQLALVLRGAGEVTRVQGPQVLSWSVEPAAAGPERRLLIRLNQPQNDAFVLQVQTQLPLGAFPQSVDAMRIHPEGAIRFGGHVRVVNEGAVRLEVLAASGLSQIPPEQFPHTDLAKALLAVPSSQVFAYRFSGPGFELRVQADNILPEVAVSEILAYHLGETDLAIDADLELDVREAPLREVLLRVPQGYAVARLTASGLGDFFLSDTGTAGESQLRIVYAAPVSGRQVVNLRLERNAALGAATWSLPRVEVLRAKSVRGHVGVSSDPGFRITPGPLQGLTEVATAFFPRKIPGLQAGFRLSDAGWQAAFAVERMPQAIQADVFHLFSVGEGIAYGSSLMNYVVSGAPISVLRVGLSNEYFNVEFTGKDVRNWQKVDGGYVVQLHTPVSGSYTLLAAYERPFKPQGETLLFNGARPLDAQSEQGHTVVVSAHQFQVQPVSVSPGLTPLEPAEVPAEYRLFFDSPVLAAYRYATRPFDLQLQLRPLNLETTVNQVVDRAVLATRVSKEGQVVTEVRYFVKNKGTPHLRLVLPEGAELWSVAVNGAPVVPVTDGRANLVPLPQQADPNALNELVVKVASRGNGSERLRIGAPVLSAPVLLSEWRVEPEPGRHLAFRRGSLEPEDGDSDASGFGALRRLVRSRPPGTVAAAGLFLLGLLLVTVWTWRLASAPAAQRGTLRHTLGGVVALGATVCAGIALFQVAVATLPFAQPPVSHLRFLAPIQPANSALAIEVSNLPRTPGVGGWILLLWPALAAVVLWGRSLLEGPGWRHAGGVLAGWLLVCWAALRAPAGAPALVACLGGFLVVHGFIPAIRAWRSAPRRPASDVGGTGIGATALLVAALLPVAAATSAAGAQAPVRRATPAAESLVQEITVDHDYAVVHATLRWLATQGEVLPMLRAPGVLTTVSSPVEGAHLVPVTSDGESSSVLVAERPGWITADYRYQVPVTTRQGEPGFVLPGPRALVSRAVLTLRAMDMDLSAPGVVSVVRREGGDAGDSAFDLVLAPASDSWIGWKPRSRDTRREKPVFYAEVTQLYVPGPGLVEGVHQVQVRPAQGELGEVQLEVPSGATITDVSSAGLQSWRFDPESRRLRVSLSPAASKPFALVVRSQIATGPLPLEQAAGLLSVVGAAGEVGLVGVATGSEVQLDEVKADALSPLNLEDFPAGVLDSMRASHAGLTLRRAFRYSAASARVTVKASAVEPDVRIESQLTLSLGEDRVVLAAALDVEITRAGIFKLSFPLPDGMDVESVSGTALSHWTELKTGAARIVTLHLKTKTEGRQQFTLNLTGPGLRSATGWTVPRLEIREASKQRGQLTVVPEQGMRLQMGARSQVAQLDPSKAGIRQKGVLVFRLLQSGWTLALDVERVDAWTQVTGLQHVKVGEAFLDVGVNLQYDIDNAGLKTLRLRLPSAADGVRFRGELVSDFRRLPPVAGDDGGAEWEVKLSRRVIGRLFVQARYTLPVADRAAEVVVAGVEARDVNLQRGFLTIQSDGRLQLRIDALPPALQGTEWQSIPRALQQDAAPSAASYAFRLVEPAYRLALKLERHEAARLLPARVNEVQLTTVISDEGMTLTQARLQMLPGDKQVLRMTLPSSSRFWFAFVNQNSVWSWTEKDQVLIPLDQHSRGGEPVLVEVFFSGVAAQSTSRVLDLALVGPRFDLPLENITWRVFLKESWKVRDWTGTLQLQDPGRVIRTGSVDSQSYVQGELSLLKEKSREAERFLSLGNSLLQKGDPEHARRAFESAYGMSQHDAAFNEDARVQLHNLKLQQAIVGLNFRQARVAGEAGALTNAPRALRDGTVPAYTQQEAQQIIERNSAEDNAVQSRLVERLIQQQEAVAARPAAIRATVPEQGRLLTFTRSLQVDSWTDLRIGLRATPARGAGLGIPVALLAGLLAFLTIFYRLFRAAITR